MRVLPSFLAKRPVLRRLALGVGALLALALIVGAGLRWWVTTSWGHAVIADQLKARTFSGQRVIVSGVDGDLLGRFSIDRLQVEDGDGAWLVGEDITVDWSASDLLFRRLKVDQLDAASVTWHRQPVLESAPPSRPSSSRPLRIDLHALVVDQLRVLALPGQDERLYRLAGSLQRDLGEGRLTVDLSPDAATGDRASGSLSWGRSVPLTGRIEARGPDDGLLKQVLGVSEPGRLLLTVDARGRMDDWTIAANVEVDQSTVLTLDADGQGMQGTGRGDVDITAFAASAGLADRIGRKVAFSGEMTESALAVELTAPSSTLSASIPVFRNTGQLDLSEIAFTATSADPDALIGVDGVSFRSIEATGTLGLKALTWRIDADAQASRARVFGQSARRIEGPVSATWYRRSRRLKVETDLAMSGARAGRGLAADILGTAPAINGTLEFEADSGELTATDLRVEMAHGAMRLNGTASADLSVVDIEGRGDISAPDGAWRLRRLVVDLGRGDAGLIDLSANARLRLRDALPIEAAWAGRSIGVAINGTYAPAGALRLTTISASGNDLDLNGQASVSADALDADLEVALGALAVPQVRFDSLQGRIGVSGSPARPAITSRLVPQGLVVSGEPIDDASALVFTRLAAPGLQGRVEAKGRWRNQDVVLAAAPEISGSDWTVPELSARLASLTATGEISGRGADLSALQANLRLDGGFEVAGQTPEIDGTIRLLAQSTDVDLSVSNWSSAGIRIDRMALVGTGTRQAFSGSLGLDAALDIGGEAKAFTLDAPVDADLETLRVSLSPSGQLDGHQISTLAPISLETDESGATLAGRLGLFDGQLDISARQTEGGLNARLGVDGINMTPVARLFGRFGITGAADGWVELSGSSEAPLGSGHLDIHGLTARRQDVGDFAIDLTLADSVLSLTGTGHDAPRALAIDFGASVPVLDKASDDVPARFTLVGQGPVAGLWSLVAPASTRFEGQFDVDVDWAGPLDRLRPDGRFKLENGEFEDGDIGLHLKQIGVSAQLTTQAIIVDDITAQGGKGGHVSGAGRYGYDGNGRVSVTLEDVRALQRSDFSATVSGALDLARAPSGANITGALDFGRVDVRLDRLPTRGYTTLDVKFPNGHDTDDPPPPPAFPVELDVDLRADRNIFVTGQGVRSEWRLRAGLGGLLQAPRLRGRAEIVNGDVTLAGRSFEFVDSAVIFNGEIEDSRLQLTAEREAPELTARVLITGTAGDPQFELNSDPAVPEDEVLSRILFGQSPSQLTPFQAAQLASALASLSGDGSLDLVGNLQDALDIDRLDFDTSAEGETTVGAGKYLTRDVYVEVRTNPVGAPGVGVEWTPRRNIVLGTELDSEESPRFTIKWKKDFDLDDAPVSTPGPEAGDAEDARDAEDATSGSPRAPETDTSPSQGSGVGGALK